MSYQMRRQRDRLMGAQMFGWTDKMILNQVYRYSGWGVSIYTTDGWGHFH